MNVNIRMINIDFIHVFKYIVIKINYSRHLSASVLLPAKL